MLHQHSSLSNPLGEDFDYRTEFEELDVEALKRDLVELMTSSQDWWPADFGHYGGLFIRMSWHAAGTYRVADGRGGGGQGAQRFAPLNSWPDNANLDKARRLLWPIKQKYGQKISWADLLVFAGNVAMESMGFETFGFGFGREDIWEPEEIFWGPEDTWLGDERYSGERELAGPLGAVQMGLIYVNPEGPNGDPDPVAAARDIRETFARMAMNDEETVALIAGGHTFGKTHGAGPADHVGPEPEAAPIEQQGLGWTSGYGSGKGRDTITSGLEVTWTSTPTRWSNGFFENLFGHEWELTESPAGAKQWQAKNGGAATIPDPADGSLARPPDDAHDRSRAPLRPGVRADLAPVPRAPGRVRRGVREGLVQAAPPRHGTAAALPRAVGPRAAALAGPGARGRSRADRRGGRRGAQADDPRLGDLDLAAGRDRVVGSGVVPRHRQARRRERRAPPPRTAEGLGRSTSRPSSRRVLADARADPAQFNDAQSGGKRVSLADLIVLGGCAAVEQAATERRPRRHRSVHARPHGRDAGADRRRVVRRARAEARRVPQLRAAGEPMPLEHGLLDRAYMLSLTAPELTVLIGGLRVLDANHGQSQHGVFTDRPEALTNDFFVNLLDMSTEWTKAGDSLRGPRPRERRPPLDGHRRRPRLRLPLPAARASPRSTHPTTPRRGSCATSSRPGRR